MTHDIVADIGGTNTRLCRVRNGQLDRNSLCKFRNDDFSSFDTVLATYGVEQAQRLCIDIAGPVTEHQGTLTNRDWVFRKDDLADQFGFSKVLIMNDLQAQGYGVSRRETSMFHSVITSTQKTEGTKLVVNVGTGFNASPVYVIDGKAFVPQNEAGHAALFNQRYGFLAADDTFLSVEDLLSGRGFFAAAMHGTKGRELSHGEIWSAAATTGSDIANSVADYLHTFGAVTGDLALTHLPFGGIYLVGGVAEAAKDFYGNGEFEAGFKSKGRFSEFMDQFDVVLCDDPENALIGCQTYLSQTD